MPESYSPQDFARVVDQHRTLIGDRLADANQAAIRQAEHRQRAMAKPWIYPARWILLESRGDGEKWHRAGIQVIWSLAVEEDGEIWLHLSASRPHPEIVMLPSYHDLKSVKALFMGSDGPAYSVWAPHASHVNINPGVLHLFSRVTGEVAVLPDFTRGMATL